MPSVYDLKPRFQDLLRPLVVWLDHRGVKANQVTAAAVVVSGLGGAALLIAPEANWPLLLIPILLLLRMGLNAIDGMLAREFGQKSSLGAILNELGDVVSDLLLYLPLALRPELGIWPVVAFIIAGLLVEFAGVISLQVGKDRRNDGPMGKSDRAFWIGLLSVFLASGMLPSSIATIYLLTMIILAVLTVIRRVERALLLQANATVGVRRPPA